MHDDALRELHIDRIYDTLIDEDDLRVCDETTREIADSLEPRPYSSREFIREMGAYLQEHGCKADSSIVHDAFKAEVPIFCPAFSDCSAGFGLVAHQHARGDGPKVSIDSAKDYYELTQLKVKNTTTGLFMVLRRHGRRSQIPTRRASEGKACRPSLARRVGIRPRADLPRRGNTTGLVVKNGNRP